MRKEGRSDSEVGKEHQALSVGLCKGKTGGCVGTQGVTFWGRFGGDREFSQLPIPIL